MLEAEIQGVRDDLVEVIIDPVKLSSYGLQLDQLIQGIGASNSLVAAGAIEGAEGNYAIKVPSLIETPEDVANLPVVAEPQRRRAGPRPRHSPVRPSRTPRRSPGSTASRPSPSRCQEAHRRQPDRDDRRRRRRSPRSSSQSKQAPHGLEVTFSQDKSIFVRQLLTDLQNQVLTAVILVFIVILYALSGRASILIGLAIPSSFLMGILAAVR